MAYRVELTSQAVGDVRLAFDYIDAQAPQRAARWLLRLYDAIDSLRMMPERCSQAPEAAAVEFDLRQYIFGNYRVLFVIENDLVLVLHVRHAARDSLQPGELNRP